MKTPQIILAIIFVLAAGAATAYFQKSAPSATLSDQETTALTQTPEKAVIDEGTGPAVSRTEQPSAAPETAAAPVSDLQMRTLSFNPVASPEKLASTYPFLLPLSLSIREADTVTNSTSQITVADDTAQSGVLLINVEGSGFCSSNGCALHALFKTDRGFIPTSSILASGPVFISVTEGTPSLHLCGDHRGPIEWRLQKDGKFKLSRVGAQAPKPAECP